jgi:uncharacterized protein YkwD
MPASFPCPKCHITIKPAAPVPGGKKVKCPKCSTVFAVPSANGSNKVQAGATASRPTPAASQFELPYDDVPRRRKRRSSGLLNLMIGSFLILAVLGGVAALVLYPKFFPSSTQHAKHDTKSSSKDSAPDTKDQPPPEENTANAGTGNEQPLLLAPADSNLVFGLNNGEARKNAALQPLVDQLLASGQILGSADFAKFAAGCKKEVGIELHELFDQMIVAANSPLGPGANSSATMIVRSSVAFDQKKLGAFLAGAGVKAIKEKGGKYYYPKCQFAEELQVVYMPSDRVLVLSDQSPDRLAPLFQADGVKALATADLLGQVAKVNQNPAWAVYQFPAEYKALATGLVNATVAKVPPNVQGGYRLLPEAKSLAVSAGVEGDQARLHISLAFANPAQAGPAAQALTVYWDNFKNVASPQILGGLKPFPEYFRTIVKDGLANTKASAQENRVEVVAQIAMPAFQGLLAELLQEGNAEVVACAQEVVVLANKPPPGKEPPFAMTPEEKTVFDQVNNHRAQKQLPPLKANPTLFKVARAHVKAMVAAGAAVDEIDGKDNKARLKDIGYEYKIAEINVGAGPNPVAIWFGALASGKIIENDKLTETGVGFIRGENNVLYIVQIYADPK